MSISGGPVARRPHSNRDLVSAPETTNLADLLERVLDKGIVIAGDITISLGAVELLTLKIRLLIASIDKAREIGIDWWESDPALSSRAKGQELASRAKEQELEGERDLLKERLDRLERLLLAPPQEADQERAHEPEEEQPAAPASVLDKEGTPIAEPKQAREAKRPQAPQRAQPPVQQAREAERPQVAPERAPEPEAEQNAAPAYALDQEDRMIAELKPLREEEQPQPQERAPLPRAAQVEQPAGGGPLPGQALQEQIAQALRPALGELRQRIAQAPQPVEQGRPAGQRGEEQQPGEQARHEGSQEEEQQQE